MFCELQYTNSSIDIYITQTVITFIFPFNAIMLLTAFFTNITDLRMPHQRDIK